MQKLAVLMAAAGFLAVVTAGTAGAAPTTVGTDKCAKMCHKVQYTSWLETKHAKAEKKTDCETCHGPGSDYMKLSIMKDPAAAKAAGLIAKPDKASCTASCHKPADITPEKITGVHAHKTK
jgi:hypothetical protein